MWCIPPEQNAEFVAGMEDVLDVYHRPYDEKRPLVCLDESSKQLIGETILPIPAKPGQPERFDHEYVRNGVMSLFMMTMPLVGWRAVQITDRRTMLDFAEVIRWLVEEVCEEAEKVVLVMDISTRTRSPADTSRGIFGRAGPPDRREVGDPSYAQARKLAEHGRDRVVGFGPAMLGSADRDEGRPGAIRGGVGGVPQRERGPSTMAFHDIRCTDQTTSALPHALSVADY